MSVQGQNPNTVVQTFPNPHAITTVRKQRLDHTHLQCTESAPLYAISAVLKHYDKQQEVFNEIFMNFGIRPL